jgi:CelD/BcsL family acetyltransferase involved in cellulose biosynthesis
MKRITHPNGRETGHQLIMCTHIICGLGHQVGRAGAREIRRPLERRKGEEAFVASALAVGPLDQGPDSTLATEVVTRWEDLSGEIQKFMGETTSNPFMRPAWLSSWYASYVPRGWKTHVVVFRRDGRLIGVAPLIVRSMRLLRVFRFAGHGLGNYLDVVSSVSEVESVVGSLLAYVRRSGAAVLEWHDLNSESPSRPLLSKYRAAPLYPNPRAVFRRDWDSHWKALARSPESRRRYRRARESLEARGDFEFVPRLTSLDDATLEEIRLLHAKRFRGTPNPLVHPKFWVFFRLLTQRDLRGDVVISLLRSQGKILSTLVGLRAGNTYVSYLLAFESAESKLQPGHVHLMLFQEYLIGAGWEVLDFSKGEDPYKRRWSNGETWNYDVPIGFTSTGVAFAFMLWVRSCLRGWARAKGLTKLGRKVLSPGRYALRAGGSA